MLTTTALVEVRDATVVLNGRKVWSEVSASVDAGEFVAILGPNGVGKSTLLKAILGLVPLAAGEIRLANGGRRGIGYLPQTRSFAARLRVRGSHVAPPGLVGDRRGVPPPCR